MGSKGSKGGGDGNANGSSTSGASSSSSTSSSRGGAIVNSAPTPNAVVINVYEPSTPSPLGGVYHSGVELYDTEYTFAGSSSSLCGILSHRPRQASTVMTSGSNSQWKYYQSIHVGSTSKSREEVRNLINEFKQSNQWPGNAYSVTAKNCNHFSEALVKSLGFSFPGWINRGAKMMNAIGMGQPAMSKQPVDLDGNPLREEDARALILETPTDVVLDGLIDLKRIGLLGGKPSCHLKDILPVDANGAGRMLPPTACIQSDADEQLLLQLPLTKPCRLLSFLLRLPVDKAAGSNESAFSPRTLKIFVNQPNLDFNDVDSVQPAQVAEIPQRPPNREYTKQERKEGVWECAVAVQTVKFTGTTFLTLFVENNHGAPTSKIHGLTLMGRDK